MVHFVVEVFERRLIFARWTCKECGQDNPNALGTEKEPPTCIACGEHHPDWRRRGV
jgi:hypothetical protein